MLSPPHVSTLFFKYENVLDDGGGHWSEVGIDDRGIKWHLKQCPSLMEEVVMAMQPTDGAERFVSYKFMSVNRLRLELAKHGWDVDGSQEVLVLASRLEIEMNRLVRNCLAECTKKDEEP